MEFKVSVILPIYNGEKTLARTLDSLVDQTFQDFELIACIDGSNDNSLNIINDFKEKFKKLTILKNEKNIGLGPTMNRLVANTSTNYIAVAEQDDYYYPERFELQVEVLDSFQNVGLVSGIADFWDGEKVSLRIPGILVEGGQYPTGEEMFMFNYLNQTKVINTAMMFKKTVHNDFGLYFSKHYPNVPIDWAYFLRFCLVSDIYGINKSLVLLDRRNQRDSVTSNREVLFSGSRELIRSFYYEYPKLIKKKDFKYAMTTQHLMELSCLDIYKFPLSFLKFFIQNPNDNRWKKYLKKRIKRFLKK